MIEADEAMKMPGGGTYDIEQGQISNDGVLCLMQTMNDGDNMDPVIAIYKKWMYGDPMDLELTFYDVIDSWNNQDSIDA
jgi:hypothetical protein